MERISSYNTFDAGVLVAAIPGRSLPLQLRWVRSSLSVARGFGEEAVAAAADDEAVAAAADVVGT
jgi:hypothetical protein